MHHGSWHSSLQGDCPDPAPALPTLRNAKQLTNASVPRHACQLLLGRVGILRWALTAAPNVWIHGFHIVNLQAPSSLTVDIGFCSSSTGPQVLWATNVIMQSLSSQSFFMWACNPLYVAGAQCSICLHTLLVVCEKAIAIPEPA